MDSPEKLPINSSQSRRDLYRRALESSIRWGIYRDGCDRGSNFAPAPTQPLTTDEATYALVVDADTGSLRVEHQVSPSS